jgi:lipid A 3-O-deacylase
MENRYNRRISRVRFRAVAKCARLVLCLPALMCFNVLAAGPADAGRCVPSERTVYWSLSVENDLFANSDHRYTSGVRVSALWAEERLPGIFRRNLDKIPFFPEHGKKRFGLQVGQSMFTSDDITDNDPPLHQRPYAGWLYTTMEVSSDTGRRLDEFQITLGVVGPHSMAEQSQKAVHEIIDSPEPMGWDTQLKTEPGLILSYQRKWKARSEFISLAGLGIDFSPHIGVSLGNVFSQAAVGGIFRIGFDLPQDYGPPLISPSMAGTNFFVPFNSLGWYLFAGFEGRVVGRNIFLDGNTWRSSRSVNKRYLVGDVMAGAVITFSKVRLAYTHVMRTREFRGQEGGDSYGAVTLTVRF